MKFASPLIPARLDKRYKRFLADVTLDDGQTVTVACPNTGTMLGLTTPGARVWLSASDNPNRKYAHTWELIETDLGAGPVMVGINPNVPNVLVAEAIAAEAIPQLAGYAQLRREVKYGLNSRIDILLDGSADARPCYVEIKNVHMMRAPGLAEFPDCKTERGAKHLEELSRMVADGCRAVMVYLVQRADAERFSLAADIDPAYRAAYDRALAAGVEMLAYRCRVGVDEIGLDGPLPIIQA